MNIISTTMVLARWLQRMMQHPQLEVEMSDELYRAAQSGDLGAIQRLPEYKDCPITPNRNNILHVLAQAGNSSAGSAVKYILEETPNLAYMKNRDGETPLVIASKKGRYEVVQQLIFAGQEKESRWCRDDMKLAAVLEAVRFNRYDVVELLLDKMPELFEKESHQFVKPRYLVDVIAEKLVCVLLDKKKKNLHVESPLYLAVEKGHYDIVEMIMSSSCKSIACHGPDDNLTALHAAAITNSSECIKMMSGKIPVDLARKDGWTPLHYAAKLDHIEIAELLLSLDKSMGYLVARNDECKTALHIAVINGHLDVIKEIIERNPQSWEMITSKGKNILHLAVENEHKQVLEWMLGRDWASELINQKDVNGNTPLHLYVFTKSLESCSLLNHPGGDRNPLNNQASTPLDMLLDIADFSENPHQSSIRDELERAGAKTSLRRISHEAETSHGDDGDKNSNTYMVIATLILTVAFAAGITVPGGYDTTKGDEGMAVLGKKAAFIVFIVSDTMAVLFSIAVVQMQLRSRDKVFVSRKLPALWFIFFLNDLSFLRGTSKMYITYALIWLALAFISGVCTIMPLLLLKIYILGMGTIYILPLAQYTLYSFLEGLERAIRY